MRTFSIVAIGIFLAGLAYGEIHPSPAITPLQPNPFIVHVNDTVVLRETINVTLDGLDQQEADAEGGVVEYKHDWRFSCLPFFDGDGGVLDGTNPSPNPSDWVQQNWSDGTAHWTSKTDNACFSDVCTVRVRNGEYSNQVVTFSVASFAVQ